MKNYFISIFILLSFSYSSVISPEEGATLHTIHVKFEWEQIPQAVEYKLDINNGAFIGETESLIYIMELNNWDAYYSWIVSPIFSDGSFGNPIGGLHNFTTSQSRSSAYAIEHNSEQYSDGITIFSSFFDYYSAAIDENGNEIWNSGNENLIFYNTDYYGKLFGAKLEASLENYLPVVEYNLNNEILWMDPNNHFVHHEMLQLPNRNFLSIAEEIQDGPIPTNIDEAFLFQILGYQVDGITDEFPWVGDRIVEWDESGNEVWSWSTFDYYNISDYDDIGGTWNAALSNGRFDWTHANALAYSEAENAIYFSSRHLSRITKIDRETGNIIWNLGMDMPSGNVHCGHDLANSFQHGLQVLDNGNIVTLDNGNLSQTINNASYPISRALEIEINETNDGCNASIVWNYDLPDTLFGFASGNVQKLENGNYLITTVGGGGTSLEVTPNSEIIWEGKYNLSLPNGAVYRANRLSSLYPVAFSVIVPDMYLNASDEITIDYDDGTTSIIIYNDGSNDETFCISLTSECYSIASGSNLEISLPTQTGLISFDITPEHRTDLNKTININVSNPPCDTGFTYFEIEDIPNSTIILDGNQCFHNDDINTLSDIISTNQLNIDSPIEIGTQNWFNGRLTRLLIGDYYDGGNVTLTSIPESISDLDNLAILYLNYNNLTSLPDSITQLFNLVYLVLSFNQITYLPESIGNLSSLIWLDIGYNNLLSIPESIGNLSNMTYLWIFNNQLTQLPETICNLNINWSGIDSNFLPYFGSGGNQLCDELPNCIANSDNINTSIDPLYYSFLITVDQTCCTLDVNNDDIINIIDIILVVNIIISEYIPTDDEFCNADSNDDDIINVLDIMAIVNMIIE